MHLITCWPLHSLNTCQYTRNQTSKIFHTSGKIATTFKPRRFTFYRCDATQKISEKLFYVIEKKKYSINSIYVVSSAPWVQLSGVQVFPVRTLLRVPAIPEKYHLDRGTKTLWQNVEHPQLAEIRWADPSRRGSCPPRVVSSSISS